MRLLIVESPNKVKKIAGFLGQGFQVAASAGHIRDLPSKGGLAVGFANGRVSPHYEITKSDQVRRLRQLAKDATEIYLATDPDREGEAIAWHLMQVLGRKNYRRVCFHAITAEAVTAAVAAPGMVDQHLVDAQQARRVLDRVVGWVVSPTLRAGLGPEARSAGRVQSVALRLVAERELEIQGFRPLDFFDLVATLHGPVPPTFRAKLESWKGEPLGHRLVARGDADAAAAACRSGPWQVIQAQTKPQVKRPPAPFTTSTVQQAASVTLKMAPEATMAALQGLFEAGHVTYIRTDSTALSPEGITAARTVIQERFGAAYVPAEPQVYQSKSANAQEAHEAIRPTHPETGPDAEGVTEHRALYRLIWERFIACQMASGSDEVTRYDLRSSSCPDALFVARGRVVLFDGWRRLGEDAAEEVREDDEETLEGALPRLAPGSLLTLEDLAVRARRTKPPVRFTQASLIKELERRGIGRPSTFAAIIRTIFDRGYVEEQKRKLVATATGLRVIAWLKDRYAGNFIEIAYTSTIEEALDAISRGERRWEEVVTAEAFSILAMAQAAGLDHDPLAGEERAAATAEPGKTCPVCQGAMRAIHGKAGLFYGCLAYPSCKGTLPGEDQPAARAVTSQSAKDPACPECGASMRKVPAKRGAYKAFWSCTKYPECKGTLR